MKKIVDGGHGFTIAFENGLTASVQWGRGNYCENRFSTFPNSASNNAEVAVFDDLTNRFLDASQFLPDDAMVISNCGAYLTPEQIVHFLFEVSKSRTEAVL
jgi:hypothetical protein